jgi:hypothetical protein
MGKAEITEERVAAIYWTYNSVSPTGSHEVRGHIGRANLDGSGVDQAFTPVLWNEDRTVPEATFGITVAGGHIYWNNPGPGTIGRSDLDGSNVNEEFIPGHVGQRSVGCRRRRRVRCTGPCSP